MFPLHRGIRFKTITESPRATSLLPPRFHKCNANNDAIISPRFLSSRSSSSSSSSSFYLSRHARAPFMSLSYYSPSRFTLNVLAPILRTGNFNGLLQFPLNRISFNEQQTESRERDGRTTKRDYYYSPYSPYDVPCVVPRRLPIAVVSIIVPVPWPRE